MNNLIHIKNAVVAEWLKSRHTRLLLTTALLPVLVTAILFLLYYHTVDTDAPGNISNPWPTLVTRTFNILCFVILPMAIIMITSQSMQIEQKASAWKQLLTYPAPRWTVMAGKYLFALGLLVSILVLIAPLLLLNGWLLDWVKPQLAFHAFAFDWGALAIAIQETLVAMLAIFAIQFVLAWLLPNYTLPILIGMLSTVVFSTVADGWSKNIYIPYAYPLLRVHHSRGNLNVAEWVGTPVFLWYSLFYFLIISVFVIYYSAYVKDKT
jgi:hypothetical protein